MRNRIKERAEINLAQHLNVIASISCTKCGASDSDYCEDPYNDYIDYLVEEKWYATDKNVYCPKCNKKRIKKNKAK